jgi:subtilase family serine protease
MRIHAWSQRVNRGVVAGTAAAALLTAMLAGPAGATATPNYTISGDVPGFVAKATDLGATAATDTTTVTVWLNLHNEGKFNQLVKDQQTKGSASYHKWLTQADINAQFAPTANEVKSVSNYLKAKGLAVVAVAENNFYVKATGTIAQIQKAFKVAIHNFKFDGKTYRSNTGNPTISDVSGAHVAAVTGLDDYGFQSDLAVAKGDVASAMTPLSSGPKGTFYAAQCLYGVESHTFSSGPVSASYTGQRYGADIANSDLGTLAPCGYSPAEMQKAYNLTASYDAGFDGTGQTIVITDAFGSPTIAQDAQVFSEVYGLPPIDLTVYQAPGTANTGRCNKTDCSGWAAETTLDVEWAHAMAPGAKIALVVAPNNGSDLDEAINWAVVHHLGNVISNSWSTYEGLGNPAKFNRDNRILMAAAAQGIDVNFSSGDNGDEIANVGIKTVDFPGSSPFATSIGGTSLFLGAQGNASQTSWGTNLTRIAGTAAAGNAPYDPPQSSPSLGYGFQFGAGGGTSLTYAKPSWQASLPGTMRQVPDVSMLADPYTGAEIIQTVDGALSFGSIGGTSLAAPMFSGVMAIATQKAGHGLGQAAPLMYSAPAGAITDVNQLAGANNVTGSITDAAGTTAYSADQLATPDPAVGSNYISAFYNSPYSTRWFVITFGTDTSLAAAPGWDNVTGVGTPNGWSFVQALGQ